MPNEYANKSKSLADRFQTLDANRSAKLTRAREHASMTIPSLLPESGHAQNNDLPVPYQSLTAEGVMAMSARMVSVIYPLNNIPFFQSGLNEALVPEGKDTTEEMKVLARLDRRVVDQLAGTNYRSSLFTCYQHLLVVGDVLLVQKNNYNFQVFRLDQYVVCRSPDGEWKELIVQEWVNPAHLVAKFRNMQNTGAPAAAPVGPNGELEAIYTQVVWNPDEELWDVCREFRGNKFDEDTQYEVPPYFPLRWTTVAGEDYGRSLIEDAYGDVRTLDLLSKALIEGSALNAEYRWGVNPSGITEIRDWDDSTNGDAIPAAPGDIFPIQAQNQAQVTVTLQAVALRESRLGRRFLMNSAVQPEGERVTARQVSILAQELEQSLGGNLSVNARDVQIPVVRRTMYQMAKDGLIPRDMSAFVADSSGKSVLKLSVKAGLEVLNREVENEKLSIIAEAWKNLPEQAQNSVNWNKWLERWMTSFGIETTGLIKSEEQMAAEQQQAQAQQQAMMAQQGAQDAALQAAKTAPAGA